jgi:hypothetical protein
MSKIEYIKFKPEKKDVVTKFELKERKYLMFIGSFIIISFFFIFFKYFEF